MLTIEDKVALFHARTLKNYCEDYDSSCRKRGVNCPFCNEKTGKCCLVDVPATWPDKMIGKEREE